MLSADGESARKEYIKHLLDQNFDEIKTAIEFDDDIFKFGGDLQLTEEEQIVKQKMHQLKQSFEKQNPGKPKEASRSQESTEHLLGEDLQRKIEEFRSSRTEQMVIFGAMFFSMIGFSIFLCKRGLFSSGQNLDDGIKSMDDVKSEREKLAGLK